MRMAYVMACFALALGAATSTGCTRSDAGVPPDATFVAPDATPAATDATNVAPDATAPSAQPAPAPVALDDYPWLPSMASLPPLVRLEARFATPAGFTRVDAPPGSYAAWLRGLPIRTDRTHVLAYDGRRLIRPSAAIVALDVGTRDVQQCADTVIRLHAEYLWHRGKADGAAYHFTSGDRSSWKDWRRGERFRIAGAKVERYRGAARGNTWKAWRGWLTHLFRYAGTQSLRRDSTPVGDGPFAAGDFMVHPGGPGHAVVLLDIAEHADGRRIALIGQGFMPAEDLHVLQMPGALDGVWFPLPGPGDGVIQTPSWPQPFGRAQARRFPMPRMP